MSDENAVTVLLNASGLKVPADELAELVGAYAKLRADLERLYAPAFAVADPFLVPSTISSVSLP